MYLRCVSDFCFDIGAQMWNQVQMVNVFSGSSKAISIWGIGQHVFCGMQQLQMLN